MMAQKKVNSWFIWKGGHPHLRQVLKDERESNGQAEKEVLGAEGITSSKHGGKIQHGI